MVRVTLTVAAILAMAFPTLAKDTVAEQYADVRAVVEELYDEGNYNIDYPYLEEEAPIELWPCGGSNDPGTVDYASVTGAMWNLANIALFAERTLKASGFPSSITDQLRRYEAAGLKQIRVAVGRGSDDIKSSMRFDQLGLDDIAAAAETYREEYLPNLDHEITTGGECGGHGFSVAIDLEDGARLWLNGEFSFKLCERQGIDPWDTLACNGWYEATGLDLEYVGGKYRYIAQWSDGNERRSVTLFNGPDDPISFVVRR